MNILQSIDSPNDLRQLEESELPMLADELRQYIMDTISQEGGHFGGNLGVIELTVALHYVFDTPIDRLIWDIGHQGYPHKVLTGRRDALPTIRKTGGLSPFLKIQESIYDHFGAGHTATSLSAALGIATARDLQDQNYHVIALIGDGAMTGGLPFEALNNIGEHGRNMIIILNDNTMSIDPNCGSLCTHFKELSNDTATSNIFTSLGLEYMGPIDGHNIHEVVDTLRKAKEETKPVVIHAKTIKGYQWPDADGDFNRAHAISKPSNDTTPKYNKVFGKELVHLGHRYHNLVAITPAMGSGSSMLEFANTFPRRYFDVGIAEQHAVTFAAGLAKEDMIPFCTIYSTFLQRAYDQIIHDVCIQDLPVRFMIDRGGLVGADGPTHHGVYDLSYLRCIPNMVIAAPRDQNKLVEMMQFAADYDDHPLAIRYPRGSGISQELRPGTAIQVGKSEIMRDGVDIMILGVGPWLYEALELAEELKSELSIKVVDMQFVKPLDEDILAKSVYIKHWISLEDNAITGGLGGAIAEWLSYENIDVKLHRLGIPDSFIPHGSISDLRRLAGCSKDQIRELIKTIKS